MTPPTLFPVQPGLVLDFSPALVLLDNLEFLIQHDRGYTTAVTYLDHRGFHGEPLPCGADPITAALNRALFPSSARAEVWDERLRLLWQKGPRSRLLLGTWDLIDSWPQVVGFLYCLEDGRFLELSPPRAYETTVT